MPLAYVSLPEPGANDALLAALAARLLARGMRVAGAVQINSPSGCARHCDMDLSVLPDGPVVRISQRLGAGSTGCRLDGGALETAVAATEARLAGADVLIINKFGKHEAEGRGFRQLIAEALARDLPVVIGLNGANAAAFRAFAADMATPLPGAVEALLLWVGGGRDGRAAAG